MNRKDLIQKIAHSADISQASADRFLTAFTKTVTDELISGGTVALVGFGTFSVSHRASRLGRNPKTGETINIPAAKVPNFKPGSALKSSVK